MKSETLIALGVVIVLLLLACAFVVVLGYYFFNGGTPQANTPSTPPAPNQTQPPQNNPPSAPNQTVQNTSSQDTALWDMITKPNVESACLAAAKQKAGSNAGLVYGCNCTESVSQDLKTYTCDISTADPFTRYYANIDCSFVDKMCSVDTNYGSQNVTFSQLQTLGS